MLLCLRSLQCLQAGIQHRGMQTSVVNHATGNLTQRKPRPRMNPPQQTESSPIRKPMRLQLRIDSPRLNRLPSPALPSLNIQNRTR